MTEASPQRVTDLDARVAVAAQSPVLLVGVDYDGTISPIVVDPESARPDAAAWSALRHLAAMPHTHAAVISGRSRDMLLTMLGDAGAVTLVGSHGAEFPDEAGAGLAPRLSPSEQAAQDRLIRELSDIATGDSGLYVEVKPLGCALHYRKAGEESARTAIDAVLSGPALVEDVFVRYGTKVIELCVRNADKGTALNRLRFQCGATAALFAGDDLTDEDVFAAMGEHDVAVKVGDDPTRAAFRLKDPSDVARLLTQLAELRQRWLAERRLDPIERHAVLSDQRTIAVIAPDGGLAWYCAPRIDSSAMFASLLGGPAAGAFTIEPLDAAGPPEQQYDGDSLVLVSRWPNVTVTHYLDAGDGRAYQRAGRSDLIRVVEGTGRVRVRFAPRMDFGRTATRLRPAGDGLVVEGTPDPISLYSPGIHWELVEDGPHHSASAELDLGGAPMVLELRYGTASLKPPGAPEAQRRRQTLNFWSTWAATLRVPPRHAELVRRSALTLKSLCYGPTGAIAAAGTTSLPEHLGGVRNWDYRYCWPRDAALAGAALVRLGNNGHAHKLLDWILGIIDSIESPEYLRPIYTVHAGNLGPEADIRELPGYGGSRPVLISNAAANQVQLDVFGPIVDLAAMLAERGAPVSAEHWRLIRSMVVAVERRWREPDHGIWEFRGPPRHHLHSKVMCWQTVNRALAVEEQLTDRRSDDWVALRDSIALDVLTHGWSDSAGAYSGAYGEAWLDAAALHVGLSGLVVPDDRRFVRTVEAVQQHLRCGPTVYRYLCDDGLPGREGGFHICTGWLIEALLLIGRRREAEALFDDLARLAGPTGLFSEQYEPRLGLALGNFPQAYSHLAIINAALALEQARPSA